MAALSSPPCIETPRLLLTWPSESQIEGFYRAIRGSAIFDTLVWDGPSDVSDLHLFWTAQRELAGPLESDLTLAAIERATGDYVGGVALRPQHGAAIVDVGYAFAPAVWGRGYATEAVGALVDEAFRVRRAERISASVFVGNNASRRVVEKLGFRLEGTLRRVIQKRGEWRDEWLLAITRPDWEARSSERPSSP